MNNHEESLQQAFKRQKMISYKSYVSGEYYCLQKATRSVNKRRRSVKGCSPLVPERPTNAIILSNRSQVRRLARIEGLMAI